MPLNLVLGQLVEREVTRARSRRLKHGGPMTASCSMRLNGLHGDLEAIVARLEGRLGLSALPPQIG